MPAPAWVRAHLPGVGTWSQRDDAPMPEGAVVLKGVEALDPAGRPIRDVPEDGPADEPTTKPATTGTAAKAATTPGDDDKAGTPTPTGTTSPIKE